MSVRQEDRLLEDWAAWRVQCSHDAGTGPCALARFREPGSTGILCARPLWTGFIRSELSQLDSLLIHKMPKDHIVLLMAAYGLTEAGFHRIVSRSGCSERTVRRVKNRARVMAGMVLCEHQ